MAARRVDAGGQQDFAQQIKHIVWHGIGNQGFGGEILRLPHGFGRQGMILGADAHHFVGKQRLVADARLRHGFGHDGQIGAVLQQEPHRVGLKAGHDIELHLRPQRAKIAHGGHEPVKTGVALHRQP